jgi:ferric-dicitrate binding protein FerR (iron transport regulator)
MQKDDSMHSDHRVDARIDEQAAQWLVNLRDPEGWRDTPLISESFIRWLAQSKRHSDALFHMARIWRKLDALGEGLCAHSQYPKSRGAIRL